MHEEIETRGRPRSRDWETACSAISKHVDKTRLETAIKGTTTVLEIQLAACKDEARRAQKKLQISASFKDLKEGLAEVGIDISLFFHDGITKVRLQKKGVKM